MAHRKTTLKDIAELAGLSVSTVSRALKGDTEIALATRDRVGKAADRLGYQPNVFARGLSTQNTRILALMTQGLHFSAFYRQCLAAFEKSAHERDYYILGCSVAQGHGLREYLPLLRGGMFAGVSFMDYSFGDVQVLDLSREVENAGVPYVVTYDDPSLPEDGYHIVRVDFADQARQAIEHLLKLGHRHIAMVAPWSRPQFLNGYLQAYSNTDLPCHRPELYNIPVGLIPEEGLMDSARKIAEEVLNLSPRPTAVFVPKAIMAGPLQFCLKRAGLRLPDDMAMVTTKDVRDYEYLDPPLTSVSVDIQEFSEASVETLVKTIEGGNETPSRIVTVPSHLIIRESCGSATGRGWHGLERRKHGKEVVL